MARELRNKIPRSKSAWHSIRTSLLTPLFHRSSRLARHSQSSNKQILKRKSFWPAFIITIALWIMLVGIIYFTDPHASGTVFIFFMVLFTAILFSASILLESTKKGFIAASAIILFLLLRYFGVGNIINFILIVGVAITASLLF